MLNYWSIVLRTYISDADRQSMFPVAYAHGPALEYVALYQEPDTILKAAEEDPEEAWADWCQGHDQEQGHVFLGKAVG